jgi:tetraprenyl-beta-curcumene synthase
MSDAGHGVVAARHDAASDRVPRGALALAWAVWRRVLPAAARALAGWRECALGLADADARAVAVASVDSRRFHAEGLATYALLAAPPWRAAAIDFIVAFQTLTDYLDNRCDRTPGLAPDDIRRLHAPLLDALLAPHADAADDVYATALVAVCRRALAALPAHAEHARVARELCGLYVESQAWKRTATEAGLRRWAVGSLGETAYAWYEAAAAANSTLTIQCLAAAAGARPSVPGAAERLRAAYFPHVQVLGVLLDNLIDRDEDAHEGHLNFGAYFRSEEALCARLADLLAVAKQRVMPLPHAAFHRTVIQGHLGLYQFDPKVVATPRLRAAFARLAREDQVPTWAISWAGRYIRGRRPEVHHA